MIRPTIPDDAASILAIATEALGFQPEELELLSGMLDTYFEAENNAEQLWLTDDDNGPVGAAYCEPERMTDGTWNLQFIAIRPDLQGQGRGGALVRYVEQTLMQRGVRLLLVETLASLERTRTFYDKCGFEEEARIRDYYEAGADKIVYRKILTPQG